MTNSRKILLGLVAAAIVGGIWYLQKPIFSGGPVISSSPNASKDALYPRARELVAPTGFINTEPFTLSSLVGKKVILLDFWTYSCINCQRTIPYLNQWYAKYKDLGLVIVGVHTPEFNFEKNIDNVRAAVKKFGIQYPVVLDSDMATWNAYQNQYWPNEYLIDADGYIVHNHPGEGEYAATEKAIQTALNELMVRQGKQGIAQRPMSTPSNVIPIDFSKVHTPELYLGSARNAGALGTGRVGVAGAQTLTMPPEKSQDPNRVYLGGSWLFSPESVRCISDCRLRLTYSAKQANIVAGATDFVTSSVLLDGKPLFETEPRVPQVAGEDVSQGSMLLIKQQRLYEIIDNEKDGYGSHTLEMEVGPGLDIFTFTFG